MISALQYLWDSVETFFVEFSTSDAARLERFSDPENGHMQLVRYCGDLINTAGIELCVRYDYQRFQETGVQDFAIELFSTQAF